MPVIGVSRQVHGDAVIETQRTDRQIKPQADTDIRAKALDRPPRGKRAGIGAKAQFGLLHLVSERRGLIRPSRDIDIRDSKGPGTGIDCADIGKYRHSRFLDEWKGDFSGGAPHRLAANWLVVG